MDPLLKEARDARNLGGYVKFGATPIARVQVIPEYRKKLDTRGKRAPRRFVKCDGCTKPMHTRKPEGEKALCAMCQHEPKSER